VPNRDSRPRKRKFRGARRYYRGLDRRASSFAPNLGTGNWFDLYHTHFDWVGHGRRGARHRRQHLAALFAAFRQVAAQVRESDQPVQVWLSVAADHEVEQDALYVHSANPNGTPFPYPFPGVEWNVHVPAFLSEFVQDAVHEVGFLEYEGAPQYIVRVRSSTIPNVPTGV
jgi:hypothetical protein